MHCFGALRAPSSNMRIRQYQGRFIGFGKSDLPTPVVPTTDKRRDPLVTLHQGVEPNVDIRLPSEQAVPSLRHPV